MRVKLEEANGRLGYFSLSRFSSGQKSKRKKEERRQDNRRTSLSMACEAFRNVEIFWDYDQKGKNRDETKTTGRILFPWHFSKISDTGCTDSSLTVCQSFPPFFFRQRFSGFLQKFRNPILHRPEESREMTQQIRPIDRGATGQIFAEYPPD